MAINDWWARDGAERYWMEITDRDDLGDDLNAPTLNGAGQKEWGYTLVTETKPGDVVLHWHAKMLGRPALVGWSTVAGPLALEDNYTWLAHGTRGRKRGTPTTGQAWRMPCIGFERLATPIDSQRLAQLEPQLKSARDELAHRVNGSLYFPFAFYRAGEVRAAQTYLAKFPALLLGLFPELAHLPGSSGDGRSSSGAGNGSASSNTAVRRLHESKLRRAIEEHAVRAAKQHYLERGATKVNELGKPYDLLVMGLGPDRHVEVKGSSVTATAVELTVNEVTHAHNHQPTDLVVVDQISIRRLDNGEYETSGGKLRIWPSWKPDESRLAPTQYRYRLSPDVSRA